MKWCFKHEREYNDICRFCDEEFQPAGQVAIVEDKLIDIDDPHCMCNNCREKRTVYEKQEA